MYTMSNILDFRAFVTLKESAAPNEGLNLHMEHFEDLMFNKGHEGIKEMLQILERIKKSFFEGCGKGEELKYSEKIDGAPSIVFGLDPLDNKFFVSTKSFFTQARKAPKSHAEIDSLFGDKPDLAHTLKVAFDELKAIGVDGVYQGDMLFTKKMLERVKVGGRDYITFQPNTVVYAVPAEMKGFSTYNMGFAIHTHYKQVGGSFRAEILKSVPNIRKTNTLYLVSPVIDIQKPDTCDPNYKAFMDAHKQILASVKFIKAADINKIAKSSLAPMLKSFAVTAYTRGGGVLTKSAFKTFVEGKEQKEIDKLKSEAGKEKRRQKAQATLEEIDGMKSIDAVLGLYAVVQPVKRIVLKVLERYKGLTTFQRGEDGGLSPFSSEGFVVIDPKNDNFYKIVDRSGFSAINQLSSRFRKT